MIIKLSCLIFAARKELRAWQLPAYVRIISSANHFFPLLPSVGIRRNTNIRDMEP